ncbi:LysR family transcriptional regulator [Variovorax defluvii]|uniref:LysR family transcriptional regulator n=1 Tax=Variovorax defluvii TaxID=913761 RepID=A0ABP8I946_9BURK
MSARTDWVRQADLLSLRIFLSAIEDGQIGLAASREHLVASAATKRIQELENLAGVQLLVRTAKGVKASAAGEVLAAHARTVFATLEAAQADMSRFANGDRGIVIVGSLRWVIRANLAQEIASFGRSHPGVSVRLREEPGTPVVLQSLAQGAIDVAVIIQLPGLDTTGADLACFRRDQLVAVLPEGHALEGRTSLRFHELLDDEFIGFAPPAPLMPALHKIAQGIGREIKVKFAAQSVEVAYSFVRAGLGVAIMPMCTLPPDIESVTAVPVDEAWAQCDMCIATARGRPLKPPVEAFIAHLRSGLEAMAAPKAITSRMEKSTFSMIN